MRRYLPGASLHVPPPAFIAGDLESPHVVQTPQNCAADAVLHRPAVEAYLLENVVVHGRFGLVTSGDSVVAESTVHLPVEQLPAGRQVDASHIAFARLPRSRRVPSGLHLMTPNSDNYFHWMLDGLSRFEASDARGFGVFGGAGRLYPPLLPRLTTPWQRQSAKMLIPKDVIPVEIEDDVELHVDRLLYVPEFAGWGWWAPHPALRTSFSRLRVTASASLTGRPIAARRRLFISRSDSRNRVLVNEDDVRRLAEAAGYETILLGGMSFAEQVKLFASASHILAPHGAGLTNLIFCPPGTKVCELHMDLHVSWVFRGLSAFGSLPYRCVIGTAIGERHAWVHANAWHVDLAFVAAMIADAQN